MGFFDRLLNVIRLNDDDDDYEEDYNEDDDLDEDDEEDDEEDFEDDKPKKRFWQKFSKSSDDEDDDLEDDEDDEDDEDPDEEDEKKSRKSFSLFRSRKSSRDDDYDEDGDDEDDEDLDEDDEEKLSRPLKSSRERSYTGSRERKSRTRKETSHRTSQSTYTASRSPTERPASYNSYNSTDWSSMVTEKPVRNTRNERKKKVNTSRGGKVEVIRPESMEDTQDIAETLMANSTVVINLEGIDVDTAQRIIDFSCGACYSLHGGLQKVSTYFYILTPENVSISGDYTSLLNGDFDLPSMRSQY